MPPADVLGEFEAGYPFGLDPFQRRGCAALAAGRGVLVAAPTGAGKTVVGEFAVHLALASGGKCFYTTPIKALSNQKYGDLVQRLGADRVGLLTGDTSVNGDADVVVMTTEVLRNMLYAGSRALAGLSHVVMDEVHYLADRSRGAVWEEVIIHLPEQVLLVSLSATVSNAEEFAEWLVTVRGDTEVVVEEHRPVPLFQHVLVGSQLLDLFDPAGEINPDLVKVAREDARFESRFGRAGRPAPRRVLRRPDVLATLDRAGLLPAITFVFSRAGCTAAVEQCLRAGLTLTSPVEAAAIRQRVEERTAALPRSDLRVLGYWDFLDGLTRGLAAHHAGMLPAFKEIVEELFAAGLVRAVFATETLALGVNMPARSVVLERLVKWNGETHADVTAGEYTQLTGRAGRRGIDVEGHAVVLWQPGLDPRQLAGLASTRTYPLRSSFRPSYNMAVNLVGSVGREQARALLESSFAQFQADRSVVGLARQVARNLEALAGYQQAMTCDLGDVQDYAALAASLSKRESELAREGSRLRRAAAAAALEQLKRGDVVQIGTGRRRGRAVVVDPGRPGPAAGDAPHPLVVTEDRWSGRVSAAELAGGEQPVGRLRIPAGFNHRSPQDRRDLASALRSMELPATRRQQPERPARSAAADATVRQLRARLRAHPVHACPERSEHLRWGERWARLRQETDQLETRVAGKTGSIARVFDRVCALLTQLGYLEPTRAEGEVTDAGRQLARVYSESDLLAVECLRAGIWEELSPDALAGCVASLVYEERRSGGTDAAAAPVLSGPLRAMSRRWAELVAVESEHNLSFLREPDPGFSRSAWLWAGGSELAVVLDDDPELTPGDFVRWCKQLVDLLGQLAEVAPPASSVRVAARAADTAVRRGVVSYSSVA